MGITGEHEHRVPVAPAAADFESWQRTSVLTSLRMAPGWTMPSEGWNELTSLLDRLAAALASGDAEEFRAVSVDLLDASPNRATRLGDEPLLPAPEPLRERVNEMIHVLVDLPAPNSEQRPKPDRP